MDNTWHGGNEVHIKRHQGVKEGVWTPCGAPPPYGGSLSPTRRRRGGRSGGSAGRGAPINRKKKEKIRKNMKNVQKHAQTGHIWSICHSFEPSQGQHLYVLLGLDNG